MEAFWRHATYCATLSQALAKALPAKHDIDPGTAYLAGLLHNFGFLLLGHLFQPEFYLLNKLAAANPKVPITQLEHRVLGMGHAQEVMDMGHGQIGAWLMQAWKLPEELVVTVREHHNEKYDGPHKQYVNLLIVANHLLKRHGIGDEHSEEVPAHVLQHLGLSLEDAESIMAQVLQGCDDWNAIAEQMAA
jgi:HD-like signal output (HDOD) protein